MASRKAPSIRKLTWARSFRRSWTHWRLKRAERKYQTELARLSLMLELVDLQHLRIKQLEETQASLLNSLEQMQEINNYRVRGELAPPLPKSELDQLLGL